MPFFPKRRERYASPHQDEVHPSASLFLSFRRRRAANVSQLRSSSAVECRSMSLASAPSVDNVGNEPVTFSAFERYEVIIDSDDERDDEVHMTEEEADLMNRLRAEFRESPAARQRAKMGAVVVPNRGLCLLPLAFWRFDWCLQTGCAPDQIKLLDLRGNGLRLLSRKVGKLRHLRALLLGGNELESVPEEIGNLTHLRWLDINSNRLRKLPDFFGRLTRLEELNLEGNMLQAKSFPKSIANTGKSLRKLQLRNNDFTEVPTSFCKLSTLEELDMRDNEITFIPKGIIQVKTLQKLLVRGGSDIASLRNQSFTRKRTSVDTNSGQTLGIIPNSVLDSSNGGLPKLVKGYSFHEITGGPGFNEPLESETEKISVRKPRVLAMPHLPSG